LAGIIAIDFHSVPTATFRTLYVFIVLSLERRLLLHVNVTAHPHAACASQQMAEAIGPEVEAARLIRDGDGSTVPSSTSGSVAWASGSCASRRGHPGRAGTPNDSSGPCAESWLDHVIVLGERHLLRFVREHTRYCNHDRQRMSLSSDSPAMRVVERPCLGKAIALPRVGGLHHRCVRQAA
jgi:hypothetical protein